MEIAYPPGYPGQNIALRSRYEIYVDCVARRIAAERLFIVATQRPRPPRIGMPNPAAVYCEQQGGTLMRVQTPQGVRSDCKLPNGEIIDEWALWRREHPDTKK